MKEQYRFTDLVTRKEAMKIMGLNTMRSLHGPSRYEERFNIKLVSIGGGVYLVVDDIQRRQSLG